MSINAERFLKSWYTANKGDNKTEPVITIRYESFEM